MKALVQSSKLYKQMEMFVGKGFIATYGFDARDYSQHLATVRN